MIFPLAKTGGQLDLGLTPFLLFCLAFTRCVFIALLMRDLCPMQPGSLLP